jgi:F0F1-type ATP synthase epsilon subunit
MESLRLIIRTPQATLLEVDAARWVQVQLGDGGIGILPNHAPLLAATVDAPLRYADAHGAQSVGVAAGILHVTAAAVTIYTSGLLDGAANGQPPAGAQRFDRLTQALLRERPSPGAPKPEQEYGQA